MSADRSDTRHETRDVQPTHGEDVPDSTGTPSNAAEERASATERRPDIAEKEPFDAAAAGRSTAGAAEGIDAADAGSEDAEQPAPELTKKEKRAAKKEAAAAKKEAEAREKEAAAAEAGEGKRSRLRWKKKELPGGLWLKCESCGQTIYRKELEEKQKVCPSCNFHFTVPGRQRIEMVLDPGSFEEHFADLEALDRLGFTDKQTYAEKVQRTAERTKQKEALICGLGSIQGRPVVIGVLDFSFLGGSMGEVVGEKISLSAELALIHDRPLVLFTSSGGARMHEGMLSLLQMAKTSAALAQLNERGGFSVCVMTHPTTGGVTASFASVCDLTLAEPGALIGFAGPRVISTTIKQELPEGFQRAEFLLQKGQLDAIVQRQELPETLARLIDFARPPE